MNYSRFITFMCLAAMAVQAQGMEVDAINLAQDRGCIAEPSMLQSIKDATLKYGAQFIPLATFLKDYAVSHPYHVALAGSTAIGVVGGTYVLYNNGSLKKLADVVRKNARNITAATVGAVGIGTAAYVANEHGVFGQAAQAASNGFANATSYVGSFFAKKEQPSFLGSLFAKPEPTMLETVKSYIPSMPSVSMPEMNLKNAGIATAAVAVTGLAAYAGYNYFFGGKKQEQKVKQPVIALNPHSREARAARVKALQQEPKPQQENKPGIVSRAVNAVVTTVTATPAAVVNKVAQGVTKTVSFKDTIIASLQSELANVNNLGKTISLVDQNNTNLCTQVRTFSRAVQAGQIERAKAIMQTIIQSL